MPRRRNLKVVKFPKPKVADDTRFIRTLVWTLGQARRGKVLGFAVSVIVETKVSQKTIGAADVLSSHDKLHLLGAMRMNERRFIELMDEDEGDSDAQPAG